MKKTNYVANDMAMSWLNRSVVKINTMLHLLDIYRCADFKTSFFFPTFLRYKYTLAKFQ